MIKKPQKDINALTQTLDKILPPSKPKLPKLALGLGDFKMLPTKIT